MKTINIYLPHLQNAKFLCDDDGKMDLIGQILFFLNEQPFARSKRPSDLEKIIPPLTISCRGKIVDSHITLALIANSTLSPREQVERGNELLKRYSIQLVPVTQKQVFQNEQVLEQALSTMSSDIQVLKLTNLARTSSYTCPHCLNSSAISDIPFSPVYNPDDEETDEYEACCNYCNQSIPDDLILKITQTFPTGLRIDF